MTLRFKLVWSLFLLLSVTAAFKLHEGGEVIDEAAVQGDGLGMDSNPFELEVGLADKPAAARGLPGGRLLAAKQKKKSKKSAKAKAKKHSVKKSQWDHKPHLHAIVTRHAKKRHSKSLKIKKNKKLQLKKPQERRLIDKTRSKSSKQNKKTEISMKAKAVPRKLADRGGHRSGDWGMDDNADFMQMMHDRQRRLSKLNIKEVPVPKKSARPSKASQVPRKLAIKKQKAAGKAKAKEQKNQKNNSVANKAKVAKKLKQTPEAKDAKDKQPVSTPLAAATSAPAVAPLQAAPVIQTPLAVQPAMYMTDRSLEEEELKAQNFVSDLQNQVHQTRQAVDLIQDKLIVIKENENEIKGMLVRLLQNRNMVV